MNYSGSEHKAVAGRDIDELLLRFDGLLYKLARAVGPHMESGHAHLPAPHYMVLKALAQDGPLRVSDVAAHLGVGNPAASMLAHSLWESGFVDRAPDPSDRRATLLSVSDEGHERLHHTEGERRRFMERVTAELSEDELATVLRGLDTIVEAIAKEHGRDTTDD